MFCTWNINTFESIENIQKSQKITFSYFEFSFSDLSFCSLTRGHQENIFNLKQKYKYEWLKYNFKLTFILSLAIGNDVVIFLQKNKRKFFTKDKVFNFLRNQNMCKNSSGGRLKYSRRFQQNYWYCFKFWLILMHVNGKNGILLPKLYWTIVRRNCSKVNLCYQAPNFKCR